MTRQHKYGAKATTVDGIRFASKAEAKRYVELKLLQKAKRIDILELQPKFELYAWLPNLSRYSVGAYVADFSYVDKRTGKIVVEDVKGFKTPLYRWKKKHVEAQYGIEITEVA